MLCYCPIFAIHDGLTIMMEQWWNTMLNAPEWNCWVLRERIPWLGWVDKGNLCLHRIISSALLISVVCTQSEPQPPKHSTYNHHYWKATPMNFPFGEAHWLHSTTQLDKWLGLLKAKKKVTYVQLHTHNMWKCHCMALPQDWSQVKASPNQPSVLPQNLCHIAVGSWRIWGIWYMYFK